MNPEFASIHLTRENLATEHVCCAIGDDKTNQVRASVKKAWIEDQLQYGYVFKKIDVRGKVFIDYVPAEYAWSPVMAPGFVFIQCFWASGRYQGQGLGARLLRECEEENQNKSGLVVVSSMKKLPFLADRKYLMNKGFVVCDTTRQGFLLMVKKFNANSPDPRFTDNARSGHIPGKKGLTFYYSDICPFVPDYVDIMIGVAKTREIPAEKIKINSWNEAQQLYAPFGVACVFLDGEFLTQEIMTESKFNKILDKISL
jgi:GNAT superfamily N-acetyltransferase